MRYFIARLIAGIFLASALVFGLGQAAEAHHPVIFGHPSCLDAETGLWQVEWTISPDAPRQGLDWSIGEAGTIPADQAFYSVERGLTGESTTKTITANWYNRAGHKVSGPTRASALVLRPEGCEPPPPTTTTEPPPPTTTEPPPPVDTCDPSTYNGSVEAQVQATGDQCVTLGHTATCGSFSASIGTNDTPYSFGVSYSVGTLDYNFDTNASVVNFEEDENGGSVDVWYWATGPESGFFTPLGLPWYNISATGPIAVGTDCEPNEETTTTQAPETTTTEVPETPTTEGPPLTTEPPTVPSDPPATEAPPVDTETPPETTGDVTPDPSTPEGLELPSTGAKANIAWAAALVTLLGILIWLGVRRPADQEDIG